MRKLLQTVIIGIGLVCANSAHALSVVFSKQMDLGGGACHDTTDRIRTQPGDVCVITGLGGSFQGEGEFGSLKQESSVEWVFHGHSCQPKTFIVVTCLR
jgi:hypothetical protein